MKLPAISKIGDAVVDAFYRLGITGEIEIRIGKGAHVRWVGQPSKHDRRIKITIEKIEK